MKKNALAYVPDFSNPKPDVYSYSIFGIYAPLLKMHKLVFFLNRFPGFALKFGKELIYNYDGRESGSFPFYYQINPLENYSICLLANQSEKTLYPKFASYYSYWLIIEGEFGAEQLGSLEEFGTQIAEVASFDKMLPSQMPNLEGLFIDIEEHLFYLQRNF